MTGRSIRTISFAGAGNVACNLAPALLNAGFEIRCILSRHPETAGSLASAVGALAIDSITGIDNETDLLLLALPDQAIPVFMLNLVNAGIYSGIVAHTSGNQSLEAITRLHPQGGVVYPLQSFTSITKPDISKVPFCIEGSSPEIAEQLAGVAGRLSNDVRFIESDQRAAIHLAAVFACNFSNYLFAVSDYLLEKSNVDPDILLPLIQETALRMRGGDAASLQTGPAVRGDRSTIERHLGMLKKSPHLLELYKTISDHIVKMKESGSPC
jgi:predicted short-subunit dehydrogenase-like oxidoreductase (DUF2520 family)